MKFVIISIILLELYIISGVSLNQEELSSKKLESNLPTTPKGKSLRNHYGVPKHYNNYGPRDILKFDHLLIKNGDGTWAGAPIPGFHGSIVTPEGNSCDITQHAYYNICSTVNDCSICAAMESCGWCESRQKCLPGNMEGCFCADSCPFKFFFDTDLKCQNIVKAGGITNINPYAKNLITAKIVDPIINITTTTVHQSIEPVEVKEGFYNTRKNISVYNPDENKVITSEADVLTPNIRKIPLPVIRIEREYKEFNAKTGKEIFNNKTLNYFGK